MCLAFGRSELHFYELSGKVNVDLVAFFWIFEIRLVNLRKREVIN